MLIHKNMATHSVLSFSLSLLFSTSIALVSIASSPSFPLTQCHDDEASALLKFKQSLTIDMCDPSEHSAYAKLESWKMLGGRSNCCSWDGVECNHANGHVTALCLSNSCLYGSLSFNSTLSKLSKLRHLDLAFNNFGNSSIQSLSGHFSQLAYLDLSSSRLSGLVPPSISQLSKLSFLNLSDNNGLILKKHHFEALVENLTRLEYLDLDRVDILSAVPKSMLNLSSLKFLNLRHCGLFGQFPAEIFNLPTLKSIFLGYNSDLGGYFPQFNSSNPIEDLVVSFTRFNGSLPVSIGNFPSLHQFDIHGCFFSGQLPTSFENLTQLTFFDLSYNPLEGVNFSTLSWLGRQTELTTLTLDHFSLKGEIPLYLANLTQLTYLSFFYCQLSGPLPSWLFQMDKLKEIDLGINQLQGPIPSSFSQLMQLSYLNLEWNNLSGKVELNMFVGIKTLCLSKNNLSLIYQGSTLKGHKFQVLELGSCNLQLFPHFLRDQDQLISLDLSYNGIHGMVPFWLLNLTRDTLEIIRLQGNFLTGFELDPIVFPWRRVKLIYLDSNMFQGPLPIPPTSTKEFSVQGNNFQGEISPKFCTLNSLSSLDFSDNNLTGEIPHCLANFIPSLKYLDLGGNSFQGNIPQAYPKDCNLKMLILDRNNFNGEIPKSLSNCSSLELLDLGNNQIEDGFPSWLGSLQQLKVLILRSNRFYGGLKGQQIGNQFQQLRVIDLSWNNLSGPLLAEYFFDWKAMEINSDNMTYLQDYDIFSHGTNVALSFHYFSMKLTNKGREITYGKVLEGFIAVDLSGNRLEGHIPISICNLRGIRLLNLSNNIFTGVIPSSLVNLSSLEALDLSQNNLFGEIPPEFVHLTFLSIFNVSNNHLAGPIPHGNQFEIFQNDSYQGNIGLCGSPLSKKCGIRPPTPPSISYEDESLFHFGWMPIVIGYACGFVFGIGLGCLVCIRKRRCMG